jgi:hypothetical protein
VGAGVVQVGDKRLDRTAERGVAGLPGLEPGVVAREPLANGYLPLATVP